MQYTKPMIDLVFQIRREAPVHYRPQIKFTNPQLLPALKSISQEVESPSLSSAVERLLDLVAAAAQPGGAPRSAPPVFPEVPEIPEAPEEADRTLPNRVYRGQRFAGY